MAVASLWLWLSLANPLVKVDGDSLCPTPKEVADRVAALLPVEQPAEPRDVARIDSDSGTIRVQLHRPDGRLVGTRVLDKRFGCADLAAAAAVVLVAWESDVHPEFLQRLPPPPVVPETIKVAPPPPPPPAPPPPGPERPAFDVGLGLAGSLAPSSGGADPAWGGLLTAAWIPTTRPVGVRLAAQAGSERALPLATGEVRWRRVTLALGAQYRFIWRDGRWLVDVHADALGSRISTRGTGFGSNLSDSSLETGAGLGARLAIRRGAVAPWLELTGAGWFRRQVAFESPSGNARVLPRLEATLAVGVSWFFGN